MALPTRPLGGVGSRGEGGKSVGGVGGGYFNSFSVEHADVPCANRKLVLNH